MRYLRKAVLLLVIVGFPLFIYQNVQTQDAIRRDGETLLMKLRPVDPRALMTGDYMVLRYDSADFGTVFRNPEPRGTLVVQRDDRAIGTVRRMMDDSGMNEDEMLLRYHLVRRWRGEQDLIYAADSFLFPEGQAKTYENARYAVLKVDAEGRAALVGLADENGQRLGSIRE